MANKEVAKYCAHEPCRCLVPHIRNTAVIPVAMPAKKR